MPTVVVQYRTKPERADENQEFIEQVFTELHDKHPVGFRYVAFRLEDGVSFVHVVTETGEPDPDSLAEMPAFQAFLAGVNDRAEVQPVARGATVVGSYRFVDDR